MDEEEFRRILDTASYKKRFPELSPETLEELYNLNLKTILETESRKYPHSVIMIYSYFYHKEHEVDRLTTAVECVRYGLTRIKFWNIFTKHKNGGDFVIEKMKFLSITGPKSDIDRVVNQYLSSMRFIWKMP